MFGPSQSGPSQAQMRCPVCRAAQAWSDTCRRCKCDLSLLRSAATACGEMRVRCLGHLRAGRLAEALQDARHAYDLCPTEEATRLLAVCHLLCQDWPAALSLADARPASHVGTPIRPDRIE